jgi:hypothetical protein
MRAMVAETPPAAPWDEGSRVPFRRLPDTARGEAGIPGEAA